MLQVRREFGADAFVSDAGEVCTVQGRHSLALWSTYIGLDWGTEEE